MKVLTRHICILSALGATLSACDDDWLETNALDRSIAEENVCASDADCLPGEACIAQRCIHPSSESYDIGIRLTYPNALDLPVTLYKHVQPGSELGEFPQPAPVNTAVTIRQNGVPMIGTLTFTQADSWHGLEDQRAVALTQDFRIDLNPSIYNITFFPEDKSLPTMFFDHIQVDAHHRFIDLDVTTSSDSLTHTNWYARNFTITYNANAQFTNSPIDPTPDNGEDFTDNKIIVRVSDKNSPASTAEITLDPDNPQADTLLPPQQLNSSRSYKIVMSQYLTPRLKLTNVLGEFTVSLETTQHSPEFSDTYGINVWDVQKQLGHLSFASDSSNTNAHVTVTAHTPKDGIPSYHWNFSSSERSGDDGYFFIEYPIIDAQKLTYTVQVTFDPDSSLASETFIFDDIQAISQIPIQKKTVLSGTVYKPDGSPLPDATLSFTTRDSGRSAGCEPIVTDQDGRYTVSLDRMTYDVAIEPPKSLGLPNAFFKIDKPEQTQMTRDFALPFPSLVYGTCIDSARNPLQKVHTEVFIRDNEGFTRKLDAASSDHTGTFRLFIPTTLE